jgi:hypothetical protein
MSSRTSSRVARAKDAQASKLAEEALLRDRLRVAHIAARAEAVASDAAGCEENYILQPFPIPIPCPTEECDFDIPEFWKPGYRPPSRRKGARGLNSARLGEGPQVPVDARNYKSLRSNLYREPAVRPSVSPAEYPMCLCTPSSGCAGNSCQNRALFMECSVGSCPSLRSSDDDNENTVVQLTKRQQEQQGRERKDEEGSGYVSGAVMLSRLARNRDVESEFNDLQKTNSDIAVTDVKEESSHDSIMESHLGKLVHVFWDDDNEWYRGIIDDYHPDKGHHIAYDDGDSEWMTDDITDCSLVRFDDNMQSSSEAKEKISSQNDKSCATDIGSKYCANTIIQRRAFPKLEVFGTPQCGYALRVLEDVEEGDILVEYLGEAITTDDMHDRIAEYTNGDDFYFAALGDGLYLDAKNYGSIARFANHSCSPTGQLQKWIVQGEPRICLVPTRPLKRGEEITYNYQYYQDGLDANNSTMTRQPCLCGSAKCCGTIGGRVQESPLDFWLAKTETILARSRVTMNVDQEGGNSSNKGKGTTSMQALMKHASDDAFAANVPSECKEMLELMELVTEAKEWQQQIQVLIGIAQFYASTGPSQSGQGVAVAELTTAAATAAASNDSTQQLYLIETAQALLDTVPKGVRFEEAAWLRDIVKKTEALDKEIAFFEQLWLIARKRKDDAGSGVGTGSMNGPSITCIRDLQWPELMRLFKAMHAVLPLRCDRADFLFFAYQQTALWTYKYLGSVIPNNYRPTALGSYSQRYKSISRCSRAYGVDNVLTDDVLIAEAFLEERMTTVLGRNDFDPQSEIGHEAFAVLNIPSSNNDSKSDHKNTIGGKNKKKAKSASKIQVKQEDLHCICCLPDDEGESSFMICCDTCSRWYHCNCINAYNPGEDVKIRVPSNSGSKNGKGKKVHTSRNIKVKTVSRAMQQSYFECPLCAFENYNGEVVNNFSLKPKYEWDENSKISPTTSASNYHRNGVEQPALRAGSGVGWSGYIAPQPKEKTKTRTIATLVTDDDNSMNDDEIKPIFEQGALEGKRPMLPLVSVTIAESMCDPIVHLKSLPLRHRVPVFSDIAMNSILPRARSDGFLTLAGIVAAIQAENALVVGGNPVLGMFHLYRKYTAQWLTKVDSFMRKPNTVFMSKAEWAANQAQIVCLNGTIRPGATGGDTRQTDTLREAMELYTSMRVLRVRPPIEISELRKFIWTVTSAKTLTTLDSNGVLPDTLTDLRSMLLVSSKSSKKSAIEKYTDSLQVALPLQNSNNGNKANTTRHLVSFDALKSIVDGGREVLSPNLSKSAQGMELFQALSANYEQVVTVLQKCIKVVASVRANHKNFGTPPRLTPSEYAEGMMTTSSGNALSEENVVSAVIEAIQICRIVDISQEYPFIALLSTVRCLAVTHDQQHENDDNNDVVQFDAKTSDHTTHMVEERDESGCELYCFCRRGEYGDMISCDICAEWYHSTCVTRNVPKKQLNKKGSVYLCPGCASLQGKKYAFGWSCNVPNGLVTQKRERNIDDTKALVQSDEATVAASLSSSSKRAKRDDNDNSSSFV